MIVLTCFHRAEDEIFFMYDTTALQREEDEIKDAIVSFYPSMVSCADASIWRRK